MLTISTANTDDLMRIRQKITIGIPCHAIEMKLNNRRAKTQSLDVDKIATSDDLINILEDDYHNESAYTKKIRDEPMTQLIDAQHADIAEYLKAIASLSYHESYENYMNCMVRAIFSFSRTQCVKSTARTNSKKLIDFLFFCATTALLRSDNESTALNLPYP